MSLLQQLQTKQQTFQDLERQLTDPGVLSDPQKLKEVSQAYGTLKEVVEIGNAYASALRQKEASEKMLQDEDPEVVVLAKMELEELTKNIQTLEEQLQEALVPKDPMDEKNAIMEIRGGTGGDEASLFAGDLYRMYTRYAEANGWKHELLSSSQNDLGGFKEVDFMIKGAGAYGTLKLEAGVHRVQRVPETEKQGRVHTSTATVAVLPEIEAREFDIPLSDLKIEATTSTGAGGQSVNTTYSAIRITHLPTGTMVYCQDERSQQQNKARALQIIRARVYAVEKEKAEQELADERRGQIGTGKRSEKIRTYNYPQDRVTDHRVGKNYSGLPGIMDGDIEAIILDLKKVVE